MLGIQLYLESKERREVIRELATYLTPNAGTERKTKRKTKYPQNTVIRYCSARNYLKTTPPKLYFSVYV